MGRLFKICIEILTQASYDISQKKRCSRLMHLKHLMHWKRLNMSLWKSHLMLPVEYLQSKS